MYTTSNRSIECIISDTRAWQASSHSRPRAAAECENDFSRVQPEPWLLFHMLFMHAKCYPHARSCAGQLTRITSVEEFGGAWTKDGLMLNVY